MTIPGSAPFASAPYGAQPVIPVIGPEGGPYNVTGPLVQTVLPAASRTSTVVSANQTNSGYRGMAVHFTVTVNPGGAQTLRLQLVGVGATPGQDVVFLDVAASVTPGTHALIYPGLSGAVVEGWLQTRNALLPALWYAIVTHSGAGAWNYVLGVELFP